MVNQPLHKALNYAIHQKIFPSLNASMATLDPYRACCPYEHSYRPLLHLSMGMAIKKLVEENHIE